MGILKYIIENSFLLVIPILVFNSFLYKRLPDEFQTEKWDQIPKAIDFIEGILRILVFFGTLLFIVDINKLIGIILYFVGVVVYFVSWIIQIRKKKYRKKLLVFIAPAWSALFWIIGIGMSSNCIFGVSWIANLIYIVFGMIFIVFHTWHATIIWKKFT